MVASWLRAGALLAGSGFTLWGIVGSPWRDAAGALTASVCLPFSVAAAAFVVAVLAHTQYSRAALWFAVAAIGQASVLQMIDAGHLLRYQHFPSLRSLAFEHPWLLTVVALQTVIVGIALVRWGCRAARGIASLSRSRLLIAVALSAVTAATVSPDPMRYVAELGFAAYLQVLGIATILLLGLSLPEGALWAVSRQLDRVFGPVSDHMETSDTRRDRFGWVAAIVTTVVAAALAIVSYERHPHVPDEVVYLQHARYFAAGMLTMPAPPVPAAFDLDLMSFEPTRWFSPVPPGWPATLAIGARVGVPWLVNPVLAGLCVFLAYVLLTHLYPRRVARYATVLLAVSPWFLFLGMSFMTHMLTLACALMAAVGIVRARHSGAIGWAVLAGVGVGATSLVRPLDGLLVGIVIALWAMGFGGSRLKLPALAALLIGTVGSGILFFPYNRMLTGDGLKFPINAYTDVHYGPKANAYGFGPDRGLGWAIDPNPGHGPVDGLINTNLNTFGLNTDLFGWSTGSLIFVCLFLCSGALSRTDRAMIAASLVIVTGYFFYYFSGGPDFAARYWFPIIIPLVALTARGIQALERSAGPRVAVSVAALVVASVITYVPWRAMDKYHHFRGMRADVRSLAARYNFTGALVLIRGERFPDYASAAAENPIDLRSPETIYAWDRSADVRAETLRAYADRPVWIVEGPSLTQSGYRVVAGPLSAGAAGLESPQ